MTSKDFRSSRHLVRGAILSLGIFLAVASVWAMSAPVRGAATLVGHIAGISGATAIAHPDGGFVSEILVRNGEIVREGDLLARIDAPQLVAELSATRHELAGLRLSQARLSAEIEGRDDFEVPVEVHPGRAGLKSEIVETHRRQMRERRLTKDARLSALKERRAATAVRIESLSAREASLARQEDLLQERLEAHESLLAKGYTTKSAIARQASEVEAIRAARGEAKADMAAAAAELVGIDGQEEEIRRHFSETTAIEMKDVSTAIEAAEERIAGLAARAGRLLLAAPVAGVIQGLSGGRQGSVIAGGEAIMYIIPYDETLEIEVPVDPVSAGNVSSGDEVGIRLLSREGMTAPRIMGKVTYVSADLEKSDLAQTPHYLMRVGIERDDIDKHSLRLGFPIQVVIPSKDRTMAQYVLRPIVERFWR